MTFIDNPLVSVYIPTYNRLPLLKRALSSVTSQTYKNLEIIVVVDNSTDGTKEYLENMVKTDGRIKIIINEVNSGACASRNRAIKEAKGEFITGLDDDDFFSEDRIEFFVRSWFSLANNYGVNQIKALYTNMLIKNGNTYRKIGRKRTVKKNELLIVNVIGNQVFTRASFLKNTMFDENLPVWQDLDCWIRLLGDGFAVNVKSFSYILDIEHEMNRISKTSMEKVEFAFDYLTQKYNLNLVESCLLKTHIYRFTDLSFSDYFYLLKCHRNLKAGYYLSARLIKKILGMRRSSTV